MDLTIASRSGRPAIAAVGVWDPLLPPHLELMLELVGTARQQHRSAVAIVIDPPPPMVMYGPGDWPVHVAVEARLEILRGLGLDAVGVLRFGREDLETGAVEFFACVDPLVDVEEYWLGAAQRLGSFEGGAPATVDRLLAERGARVRRLPETDLPVRAAEVRRALGAGSAARAANLAGRHPILARPPDGVIRAAWPPGEYVAVALDAISVDADRLIGLPSVRFALEADGPGPRLGQWPVDAPWLAVLSGPADPVPAR